jgi:hypothetical protein
LTIKYNNVKPQAEAENDCSNKEANLEDEKCGGVHGEGV